MTERPRGSFWITNHLANPLLGMLLRSPLGGRLGRRFALLSYYGRRSGQRHELVVQYAREGTLVWIIPGRPERKTWWRNLRETRSVELRLAGEEFQGLAIALTGDEHPDELRRAEAAYRRQRPHTASAPGIPSSSGGTPSSSPIGPSNEVVIVRVDLQDGSMPDSE